MRCKIPVNDLHKRLDKTYCMYKKTPVYVVVEGPGLYLYCVEAKKHIANISPDDPEFDISTPPLGYYQLLPTVVIYVTRVPARLYKQGFDHHVAKFEVLGGKSAGNYNVSLKSKSVSDMMSGVYPSLKKALKDLALARKDADATIRPIDPQIAISNDCCLSMDVKGLIHVWFQQQHVGILREEVLPMPRPTVIVPSAKDGWIVSIYLREFDWVVE